MTTKKKSIFALSGILTIAFGAWLAFGFFGIQSAFIDNKVDEAGPIFTASAADDGAIPGTEATDDSAEPAVTPTGATEADETDAPEELSATEEPTTQDVAATEIEADTESATLAETEEEAPAEEAPAEEAPAEEAPTTEAPTTEAPAAEETDAPAEIITAFQGEFSGSSRYDVSGDAAVLTNGTEQRFLRFEGFESTNGPDLKVYLRADDGSFVNLGVLKGNVGDQNYEIPPDVDLSQFSTVEIWCERFSVGFGAASLAAV